MLLLLAALLSFQPFDSGLPRSGQWRHGFAVADMNGDGRPDLAFSPARKQPGPPVIFLNEGGGRWRRWSEATYPPLPFDYGAVAAGDFDGNGTTDLAIASHYRGVTAMVGDGKGNFTAFGEGMAFPATSREAASFSSRAIVAMDWNGDGLTDLAALSDGPRPGVPGVQLGITIWRNVGTSWQAMRATKPESVFGDAIATGDIDGDRIPDLVTASSVLGDKRVVRLGSDPQLEPREVATLLPAATVRAVALRDFDGDARDEIVVGYTSASAVSIELVSWSGEPRRIWSETGSEVSALAAGDVNGDGAADVVAALQDGRMLMFRGDGRGFVVRDAELAVPEWRRGCAPYDVKVADLDGDTRGEVIATFAGESSGCTSGGGVEVWRASTSEAPQPSRRRAVRH